MVNPDPELSVVAPHRGAWIETACCSAASLRPPRSPLTEGRGLKLSLLKLDGGNCMSPLTEGRGLKRKRQESCYCSVRVAPHRGAWIETVMPELLNSSPMSPLTEGRGLKRSFMQSYNEAMSSPLTEGRGLKPASIAETISRRTSPLTEGRGLKQPPLQWLP